MHDRFFATALTTVAAAVWLAAFLPGCAAQQPEPSVPVVDIDDAGPFPPYDPLGPDPVRFAWDEAPGRPDGLGEEDRARAYPGHTTGKMRCTALPSACRSPR